MSESPTVIHYVDAGHFYSVYGISTMIVVILLMWYFIRTNLESKCNVNHTHPNHTHPNHAHPNHAHPNHREGLGGIPIEDPDIMNLMPLPEYAPIQISEGEHKPYKHWGGLYGDVPLYIYDVKDVAYKPEWDHNTGIYVPNMRTIYRQTYTPIEASFW